MACKDAGPKGRDRKQKAEEALLAFSLALNGVVLDSLLLLFSLGLTLIDGVGRIVNFAIVSA